MNEDSGPESGREQALDVVDVLLHRSEVVESLLEEPKTKRDLVEDTDASRSTVDRATKELETVGLIEYVDGSFAVTSFGKHAEAEFSGLVDTLRLREQLDSFLRWVPDSEQDFDLGMIADADIALPEPGNPYNMVNKHVQGLEEADTVRAVLPVTGLHGFEAAHEAVVENGADYEFVAIPEVAETHESNSNYAPMYEEMVETGRFDAYVYEGEVPYYLGLLDGTVQIGVDDGGKPRALLETDSDEMQGWAENKYRDYKQRAEKVI
jgi:predicted transcriptional regulator